MSLIEELYSGQDEDKLRRIWEYFPFLDPSLAFLANDSVKMAIKDGDKEHLLRPIIFNLFPSSIEMDPVEAFRLSMNRGIDTLNSLCSRYLDHKVPGVFFAEPIFEPLNDRDYPPKPKPLDLFELLKQAVENRERFAAGDTNPQLLVEAYSTMRAIELGYRACVIDESAQVSNSLRYYEDVVKTLGTLIGFKDQRKTNVEGFTNEWETNAGVCVLSPNEKPMGSRLKYLTRDDPPRTEYSSILIKTYSGLRSPEDIRDYTGVEIVVKDEEERQRLVSYIRDRTSLTGVLERYKDTTVSPLGDSSSSGFRVTKFILRLPFRIGERNVPFDKLRSYGKWNDERGLTLYQRVPVEVQIFTAEDYRRKEAIPEVSHREYRRRQFMDVFPALFPRQIYEPVLRAA